MAAITIVTNLAKVMSSIVSSFELLKDKEYLLRPLAIETIPLMKERIHIDGKASDGTPIGSYSDGYMSKRKANGRTDSRKVIVVLTSQLEKDWSVQPTQKGYGIGFNNSFNTDKMRWVEENKGKIIANLSAAEKKYINERLQDLVNGSINS